MIGLSFDVIAQRTNGWDDIRHHLSIFLSA